MWLTKSGVIVAFSDPACTNPTSKKLPLSNLETDPGTLTSVAVYCLIVWPCLILKWLAARACHVWYRSPSGPTSGGSYDGKARHGSLSHFFVCGSIARLRCSSVKIDCFFLFRPCFVLRDFHARICPRCSASKRGFCCPSHILF